MKVKVKINGEEKEMDAQAAVDTLQTLLEAAETRASDANKAAKDELEEKTKPEALDALVEKKLTERAAQAALDEKRSAVAKAYPKMALDGKSDETIETLFLTLDSDQSVLDAAPGDQNPGKPTQAEAEDEKDEPLSARDEMLADLSARARNTPSE